MIHPIRIALIFTVCLSAPLLAEDKPAAVTKNVKPDEFEKVIAQEGVIVLDVRLNSEYKTRHIKGAVLMARPNTPAPYVPPANA